MSSKALSIANGLANLFGSDARQGASAKQAPTKKIYDKTLSNAGQMVANGDPAKRAAISKVFQK